MSDLNAPEPQLFEADGDPTTEDLVRQDIFHNQPSDLLPALGAEVDPIEPYEGATEVRP
jgi:hypothetical protein